MQWQSSIRSSIFVGQKEIYKERTSTVGFPVSLVTVPTLATIAPLVVMAICNIRQTEVCVSCTLVYICTRHTVTLGNGKP